MSAAPSSSRGMRAHVRNKAAHLPTWTSKFTSLRQVGALRLLKKMRQVRVACLIGFYSFARGVLHRTDAHCGGLVTTMPPHRVRSETRPHGCLPSIVKGKPLRQRKFSLHQLRMESTLAQGAVSLIKHYGKLLEVNCILHCWTTGREG